MATLLLLSEGLSILQYSNHRAAVFDLLAKEAPPYLVEHLTTQLALLTMFDTRGTAAGSAESLSDELPVSSRARSPFPLRFSHSRKSQEPSSSLSFTPL